MEIRVLKYFLTVVQEESINKAADVLHITQPTLSRQLALMEEQLGVTLFKRSSKGISLTNEGMLLRRRAEEILDLVEKTEKELVEQDELIEGKITIGCGELAAVEVLAKILGEFHEKYPRVQFDLFTATADMVKEQMEKGLVDIGVLLEPVDMEKYEFIRLGCKEKWVVVMRADDPMAERTSVTAKDLEELPLILPRRMGVQNELASWFGDSYKKLDVRFTSNFVNNASIMVRNGLGYAVVVEKALVFGEQEVLTWRPLSPELTSNSVFTWKRNQPFSPAATKLMEYIKCFLGITMTDNIGISNN